MAEPRMRLRQKGQQFGENELAGLLQAFGDDSNPLKSTMLALDEIITDFIIETCHAAALSASYSRRQKIKVDDFKWVLRRDARKLGRVTEIFFAEKIIRENRKAFNFGEDAGVTAIAKKGKGGVGAGGALAEIAGEGEDGDEGGRKKKKRKIDDK
ncbi:hypothetical protein MBLNU459_g6273t1 [Dothideomycetes sp. NU459]